jgi:hypothetical protein
MRRAALAAAVLAACTPAGPTGSPTPGPTAAPTSSPAPGAAVPVVGTGPAVNGMRLAAGETGLGLELIDPNGDPVGALRTAVASGPPAVLVVGNSGAVTAVRPEIEAARVPVIEVGEDLYSDRALFRYAFQVSIPLTWQARVLAHYLVTDRGYDRIGAVGEPGVAANALAEEGRSPVDPADAETLLLLAGPPPEGTAELQLALPDNGLSLTAAPRPGTVACAPYTWSGWADMIPRVHRFRLRFAERFGREPGLAEQEGYDAVRAVAEALEMTGGAGGDALVRALESFRDRTYSSTAIRLGPDDHVFAEESHLGLFAVAQPGTRAPGEDLEPVPWRPVMRTFTTDGKRVNLNRPDVRLFFPGWGPRRPRPNYWRSEYGIVTRPDDPLH